MKKRSIIMLALVSLLLLTLGQTVWAFKDIKNDANEQKIAELQKRGIVNGDKHDRFNPKGKLTYAEGVTLLVRGFDLNIDNIRFIKEPKATDYFPNLKDNAWYSQSFIIAQLNGLEIPKDVKASDAMTREQFAHHLFKAIMKQGDYAFIEIFLLIADVADVDKAYMDSIQKLLISKIATLDDTNKFYPKQAITRGIAAGWLYDALKFVKETEPIPPQPEVPAFDLKLAVTPVNDEVNKVTVSTQVPHPGYGIRIASIAFEGEEAVIYVETVLPDPDKMYPQVVTDVSAVTYVDAAFKPVLPATGGGSDPSVGSESAQ
ncbi:S-layer homology domain-containing protein [Paenibacillus arenilitoris]|uniref:S-layer homology domain-containing protein n=1 Tax=Paenibacillus arenilitoris TaxID=2772299 RepID=A0A927CQI2_9BACL|nr:S-layer homology domain-containing protein [Paenibacillus arenilitoris]MBD2870086.1 S-layer homology domain-containing protein [Paenibacillus arenilitoris]